MFERILNTIYSIQKLYLKYPTIGGNFKHGERVFCYEFYYHLKQRFHDLLLDVTGEPIKGRGLLPGLNQVVIPDFVIHNYGNNNHNEIAIEVKVSPGITGKQIFQDLDKLNRMIIGPLGYNMGVFIIANADFESKVENSRLYRRRIRRIITNNHRIQVVNILPLDENEHLNEFITENDIEQFNYENI